MKLQVFKVTKGFRIDLIGIENDEFILQTCFETMVKKVNNKKIMITHHKYFNGIWSLYCEGKVPYEQSPVCNQIRSIFLNINKNEG